MVQSRLELLVCILFTLRGHAAPATVRNIVVSGKVFVAYNQAGDPDSAKKARDLSS